MQSIKEANLTRRQLVALGIGALPCMFALPSLASATTLENGVVMEVTHDPAESGLNGKMPLSWYSSTLYFGGSTSNTILTGSSRYYDGNSIGIEMTCSKSMGTTCDSHFSVELWRGKAGSGTYIGSAAFAREGFTKATWTNVGSGTYTFRFVKCPDTQVITSSSVAMYSW